MCSFMSRKRGSLLKLAKCIFSSLTSTNTDVTLQKMKLRKFCDNEFVNNLRWHSLNVNRRFLFDFRPIFYFCMFCVCVFNVANKYLFRHFFLVFFFTKIRGLSLRANKSPCLTAPWMNGGWVKAFSVIINVSCWRGERWCAGEWKNITSHYSAINTRFSEKYSLD